MKIIFCLTVLLLPFSMSLAATPPSDLPDPCPTLNGLPNTFESTMNPQDVLKEWKTRLSKAVSDNSILLLDYQTTESRYWVINNKWRVVVTRPNGDYTRGLYRVNFETKRIFARSPIIQEPMPADIHAGIEYAKYGMAFDREIVNSFMLWITVRLRDGLRRNAEKNGVSFFIQTAGAPTSAELEISHLVIEYLLTREAMLRTIPFYKDLTERYPVFKTSPWENIKIREYLMANVPLLANNLTADILDFFDHYELDTILTGLGYPRLSELLNIIKSGRSGKSVEGTEEEKAKGAQIAQELSKKYQRDLTKKIKTFESTLRLLKPLIRELGYNNKPVLQAIFDFVLGSKNPRIISEFIETLYKNTLARLDFVFLNSVQVKWPELLSMLGSSRTEHPAFIYEISARLLTDISARVKILGNKTDAEITTEVEQARDIYFATIKYFRDSGNTHTAVSFENEFKNLFNNTNPTP